MPKIKARKSITKRFKLTGSGKIMRRQINRSHILVDKEPKRMRRLHKMVEVNPADRKRLLHFLSR